MEPSCSVTGVVRLSIWLMIRPYTVQKMGLIHENQTLKGQQHV